MDANKLAVLVNQLGGYDEAEKVIGVDAELIQRAVSGERLSRLETAQLETGFNQLLLEPEVARRAKIDINEIDHFAQRFEYITTRTYDLEFTDSFRELIADDVVGLDDLNIGALSLINFPAKMLDRIKDLIAENSEDLAETLHGLFEGYEHDQANGVPFWKEDQLEYDSEFWAIWRELFYGDE